MLLVLRDLVRWFLPLWFALAGLPYSVSAEPAIKIGEIDPLTGGVSQFGIGCHQGFQLAIDEINMTGGLLGSKVELISEDTASKPGQSSTAIRKLITQDQVLAVLGDATSSASLEAGMVAQSEKVPMITPSATNPRITEIGDFIFRVCFLDEFQGRLLAHFAYNHLKARKMATMTDVKQDYSVDLTRFFKEEFAKLGGAIVREQSYSSGDTDFRAQLSAIRAVRPDAVCVPGYYPEASIMIKQARSVGLTMPFIGCDGWANQSLIDVGGKALDGCYFTNHFSPDDPSPVVRTFVDRFKEKFGKAPDTFSALGYDAARLLAEAIKKAGSPDRAAVRTALSQMTGFEGVTGKISIDAHRNASKAGVIVTVKEGRFELVQGATDDPG
jgi:branched-chain amino acid transport system substrate-binding protein